MHISEEYFIKMLLDKLKVINKRLCDVDNVLYDKEEFFDEWYNVRESNLEIDELIDGIEKK